MSRLIFRSSCSADRMDTFVSEKSQNGQTPPHVRILSSRRIFATAVVEFDFFLTRPSLHRPLVLNVFAMLCLAGELGCARNCLLVG